MEAQKKEAVATIDYSGPALLPEKGHAYFIFTECINLLGRYLLERIQHLLHCMLSGSVGIGILSAFLFDFPSHLPFALSGDWIG